MECPTGLPLMACGLAMWWNLKIVCLKSQPNKNTKDEVNKQKPNRITSAETAADYDIMLKLTMYSHHSAKPRCAFAFYPPTKCELTIFLKLLLILEVLRQAISFPFKILRLAFVLAW